MKTLYIFYDGECGMCCHCREWLASQPTYLNLIFHPFQSSEARQICPYLPYLKPERQLIIQSDESGIYLGEKSWLMCLYALRNYRGWAHRLSTPALRPLARRICLLISQNRVRLSQALFMLPVHVLQRAVENAEEDVDEGQEVASMPSACSIES